MPAPYSNDLREKIIKAYEDKEGSMAKLARRFHVSLGFIKNLRQRYRQTGSVEPQPHGGGHPPIFTPARQERLRRYVKEHCDATLAELLRWSRLNCCVETVSRTLIRMGLGRKKKRNDRPNGTAPMCKRRALSIGRR